MFKNKARTFLLLTLIFVTLLGVSAAAAADIDNDATDATGIAQETATQASDVSVPTTDVSNKAITKNTQQDIKTDGEANFTTLYDDIKDTSEVTLAKDYTHVSDDYGVISITEDKIIDGAGFSINNVTSGLFIVSVDKTLTLKNLKINSGEATDAHIITLNGNIICENVTFDMGSSARSSNSVIYYNTNLATAKIIDSEFKNFNTSGGGIYLYRYGNLTVDGTNFTNISANNNPIKLNNAYANATITNSRFVGCIGANQGGAILFNNYNQIGLIENCYFADNIASAGGGAIRTNAGNLTIRNSEFYNNKNSGSGTYAYGAICVGNNYANLYLDSNTMNNPDVAAAEIYVYQGNISSPYITGQDVQANAGEEVTISYNLTDNNGNSICFKDASFSFEVNEQSYSASYERGVISKSITAPAADGTYPVTIKYTGMRIVEGDGVVLTDANLIVGNPAPATVIITDETYSQFFDENGAIKKGAIAEGSTVKMDGTFKDRNFDITMPLTITTGNNQAVMDNCTFLVKDEVTIENIEFLSAWGPTYSTYISNINNTGSLTVINSSFKYNSDARTYGGFITTGKDSNLTIIDSVFDGGLTVRSQVYTEGANYSMLIDGCTFKNYNASNAAVGLNQAGNLTLIDSTFKDNIESSYGGGLYVNNKDCIVEVEGCTFENLVANYRGGAIYSQGNLTVINNVFKNLRQSNPTSTYVAGAIYVSNNYALLYLENNTMENNTANRADVYIEYGKLTSPLYVSGDNVTVDQEDPVTLNYAVGDDKGNGVDFNSSPFIIVINEERITSTYGNGTLTASFDASYDPGEYNITITCDDTNLLGGAIIPNTTLTVRDIGLINYAAVQALIDAADDDSTVTIDGPVLRASDEECIMIPADKKLTIDFTGNTVNAKGGKVFGALNNSDSELTIKNAIFMNIGNANPLNDNVEGRFIVLNNSDLTLNNVTFKNGKTPSNGNAASGSFILTISDVLEGNSLTLTDCTVENCSGTFINNIKGMVLLNNDVFKDNNLYLGYSQSWNAIISSGGYLEARNSQFINNSPNWAVIDGQSQSLPMGVYGSTMLSYNNEFVIYNCIFENNYASSGKAGAIHTYNDTTVTDSIFIFNRINGYSNYGGAISSEGGLLTIDYCIFENNSARYSVSTWSGTVSGNDGTAIYNKAGDLNIKNSLIISNVTEFAAVYNAASGASVVANNNYWGSDDPTIFYKSTTSGETITVDKWVILNLTVESTEPEISYRDTVSVIASFILTDGTDEFKLEESIPDYGEITFSSKDGTFSEYSDEIIDGEAITSFTVNNSPFTITASYHDSEAVYVGEAVMPEPQIITLNDANWSSYFNDDGSINGDAVTPKSELRFEGTFNNRVMVIDMPLNLTTAQTQAVLNNCTFLVLMDNVNITKLKMISDDTEDTLITLESASNVNIEDNSLTLTNNENKVITHPIEIYGGSDNIIRGNNITTIGPEENIVYGSDYSVKLIYTTSIFSNSAGLVIDSNNITTRKNSKDASSLGTIYGIYVYGKNNDNKLENIQITNNNFITEGTVYDYGVKSSWIQNSLIENNTVTTTGVFFASGIHPFVITESKINNNTVTSKATDMAYGIVLEGAMDYTSYDVYSPEENDVTNNNVNIESSYAWGIETFAGISNTLKYNNITINAGEAVGMGITDQDTVASYNNMVVTATNDVQVSGSFDYIDPYTAGIKIANNGLQTVSDNEIIFNNITVNAQRSTVPAVNSSTNWNEITDNFFIAPCGVGDSAVVDTGKYGTVEDNQPDCVITDETYSIYFDEECVLKAIFNNTDLKVSGEFVNNIVFIFDGVNVTFTNDGTAVFHEGQVMVGNDATVVFDGLVFENSMDAFVLESSGNIINNTVITINSEDLIHAVSIYEDGNIIANTVVNVTAPSGDVLYNSDWSTKAPAPTAILVSSSYNLLDNVTVIFNAPTATGYYPTVNGIHIGSVTGPIENNVILDSKVRVNGTNFTYGINVGNAKYTTLKNIDVVVSSDYYADAIQLFDADTITVDGIVKAIAGAQAYGVYSTAMGIGFSQNIDLTGLDVEVNAINSTGVLLEGARNAVIADAAYNITGDIAVAISSIVDWMPNIPSNITVNNVTANIMINEGEESYGYLLYFETASDILVENSTLISNGYSSIMFNNVTSPKLSNVMVVNSTIYTLDIADLMIDNLTLENINLPAVYFESDGSVINNSYITVTSTVPLRVVEFTGNSNIIANTVIDATIPSADVPYDSDNVGLPISSGLYISSDNNLVDNVTVNVDGSQMVEGSYFPTIDAIDVQSMGKKYVIENNIIRDTSIYVRGSNYVYGINVGRAKNTVIDDLYVKARSDYYADAIQLFDANNISINGEVVSISDSEGYGVYATAMAIGSSKGIDLTGLDVTVISPKATGVLIEGASDVVIADAYYSLGGENVTAVNVHKDWMQNVPRNIEIRELDVEIDATGYANVMYFSEADGVTITDNDIEANQGSYIYFDQTPNGVVKDNYILVGDVSEGIFGNHAVETTETDTIVENNTPTSKLIDELEEKIDELENRTEELENKTAELENKLSDLEAQLAALAEQLAALAEQNAQQQGQIDALNSTVNELNSTVENQQGQIGDMNSTINEQAGQIENLNNTVTEQGQTIENQQAQIGDMNSTINEQAGQIETLNNTVAEQAETINSLNDTVNSQAQTIADQAAEIDELEGEVEELEAIIEELIKPKETKLTIDPIEDAQYGDRVSITGMLTDADGNAVVGTVHLLINGGRATAVSDTTGAFSYDYKLTNVGEYVINATYDGNSKYTASNATITFNADKQDSEVELDDIEAVTSGDKVTITGVLVDGNGNGFYGTIKLQINNGKATVKTDEYGNFIYETTLTTVGINNITASYVESAKYYGSDSKITVNVKALETSIVLDDIAPIKSGESITIKGKLLDEKGNAVVGSVKLLINSGRATVKTDENGEFTYEYVLSLVGTNNITVSYLGANKYLASNVTTTVEVSALKTVLTIDPIAGAKKGETINITGKLTDEKGNAIIGTIKLVINGGRATVKTDENGFFTYEYTVTKVGTLEVSASYLGTNRYEASNATATAEVAKLNTKITINPIGTVTQKSTIDITGTLADENGVGIYGTVKLLINNGRATVKTDDKGVFTYSYTATKVGENTVTATYAESTSYEATETTVKFKVQ